MACNKSEIAAKVKKKLLKDLKNKFPEASGADIRAMANEVTEGVINKAAENVANAEDDAELSPAVLSKASTEKPTDMPEVVVPEVVMTLGDAFANNLATRTEVLNAETAAGLRNADGDMIATPVKPRTKDEMMAEMDIQQVHLTAGLAKSMKRLREDLIYSRDNEAIDASEVRSIQGKIDEIDYDMPSYEADSKKAQETLDIAGIEVIEDTAEDIGTIADAFASVLGSKQLDFDMTPGEADAFYYDEDGSMTNAENVNNALKELDAKQFGENHDTEWSAQLDETLASITELIGDLNKAELKLKKSTIEETFGTYDPNTGEIVLNIDAKGNGQDFRNRFTMSSQETYVHEVVHSAVDFIFDRENVRAGVNTELAALASEAKKLYSLARKNSSWEDMLVNTKHPTKHEVAQAKERYEYIFDNKYGNGLHEFMAHLLTNKQFADAMRQVESGIQGKDVRTQARKAADIKSGKTAAVAQDVNILDRILDGFRELLNKMVGIATSKDGSITDSGAKLIFNIMAANKKAADKVSAKQAVSIPAKSVQVLEELMGKVGEKFDEADAKLQDPIEKGFNAVLGKMDTGAAKGRFEREYKRNKEQFFKLKKADTDEKRAAIEEEADKAATAEAEQTIADEAAKIGAKIKKASKEIKEAAIDRKYAGPSNIYGVEALKGIARLPKELMLLARLHSVSRGVYGAELAEQFAHEYRRMSDKMKRFEESFIGQILEDYYDKDSLYNEITDAILALTHTVDGYRESMYEDTLAQSKEWFGSVDIHSNENKHYDMAMSNVIMRTDLQALNVDAKGLLGLLTNPKKVTNRIAKLKSELTPQQVKDSISTAHSMVDGMGTISNATNIARGFGTTRPIATAKPETVAKIDELISLMALDMTEEQSKTDMTDFLTGKGYDEYLAKIEKRLGSKFKSTKSTRMSQGEYTDQVLYGVNMFIAYSRGMQNASAQEMALNPHNIIKGYMKETYSHDITIEYFPLDQIKEREREGYTYIREVGKQTKDGPAYGLFTIKDNTTKRANGALGLQSTKQRGTTLADIVHRDNPTLDNQNKQEIFKEELRTAIKKYKAGNEKMGMYPVYDAKGKIVNFRSIMNKQEKEELLDMESRGTQNLARSFGTSTTAKTTDRHNKSILKRLMKDFSDNYDENPDAYVEIKPEEADAEGQYGIAANLAKTEESESYSRMWARLPKSTRDAATEMWGETNAFGKNINGKIIVRKDLVLPLFGYDEVTITDMENAQKWSNKTRAKAKLFEKLFQDLMQIAKGNIVIKDTAVLIGNLTSNAKILGYVGLNPVKGTKLLLLGQKELARYEADNKELKRLNRDKLAGLKVSERRIKELEKEVKENSVAPLIEAGLYQSVVEDVSTKMDNNRVSNWFNDKRDEYVTNETANTAIQYMFLTEKTKPFQILLKGTQVSDFYFRYAQYHDAIDNKGLSEKEALREVTDNYINYEAPLNKYVKYGDRMGPFFFITYFTRIQRVIKRIAKKNPARVTADIMQQFMFTDQDDILDQSIFDASIAGHYNPFKIFGNIWEAVSPSGLEFIPGFGK